MAPLTLDTISQDARFLIIQHLSERKDLANLCQVSKTLLDDTLPHLYRSLSLHAPEHDVERFPLRSVVEARHKGSLRHTREIRLWSRFHTTTYARCMHNLSDYDVDNSDFDDLDFDGPDSDDSDFDNPKDDPWTPVQCLQDVLSACDAGSIRSFIWEMGTCVPQELLGPKGYFELHQPNIETIRLVTDGSCYWNEERDTRLALSAFPRLKRLSWKGVSSTGDMESFAEALTQRSRQLEELEIDLTQQRDGLHPEDFEDSEHGELVEILNLPGRGSGTFPALKKLALSSAWLTAGSTKSVQERVLRDIHAAFDFSGLSSLCLRDCAGWDGLLKALSTDPQPIRLKDLEIQVSDKGEQWGDTYTVICTFLRKFQGLEGLFVYTTDFEDTIELWQALTHHRTTLIRFVQHQRSMNLNEESDGFEDHVDSADLSTEDPEDVDAGPGNPLAQLDLVALGLGCIPRFMRSFVSPFASKDSLQVLHMRQSGTDLWGYRRSATDIGYSCWAVSAEEEDTPFDSSGMDMPEGWKRNLGQYFVDFAQWAFGPSGIRSLKLLAYGDFSYDGRFAKATVLLRRREPPPGSVDDGQFLYFDELREGQDWELWELYRRESHVLAACPTDTLFRDR